MAKAKVRTVAKSAGIMLPADYLTFLDTQSTSLRSPEYDPTDDEDDGDAWANQIAEIFGAKQIEKVLTRKRGDFWDPALHRHAVPVARTWDGDPVLLVVAGRSAGHVLLGNHETYYGFFENLARLGGTRVDAEFEQAAGPILRRRGYRGGAPTTDHVVSLLLHPDLEGGERIARSFSAFLRSYERARRGKAAPKLAKGEIAITPMEWRIWSFARLGERLFAIGEGGKKRAPWKVLEVHADGRVDALAPAPADATLRAVHGRLYITARRGLWSWIPGKTPRQLLRGAFEGVGSDGRKGVWAIASERKPRGDVMDRHIRLFRSRDGQRFTAVPTDREGLVSVHNASKQGLLLSAFEPGEDAYYVQSLFVLEPSGKLVDLDVPDDEGVEDVLVTRRNTLVAAMEITLWRSTTSGRSWTRVRGVPSGNWGDEARLLELSNGSVVLLRRRKLFVSRNDGASFSALPVRFKASVDAAVELDGQLLIAAQRTLYRMCLASS